MLYNFTVPQHMDWQYSPMNSLYRSTVILKREDGAWDIIQCSNTEPHSTVKLLLLLSSMLEQLVPMLTFCPLSQNVTSHNCS